MIAASSSNTHSSRAPIVLATPRWLVNVHSRANARYVTNRKMLEAQHRCALAFHRLVTGSQIRLAITTLATPTTKLCSETLSSFSTPATAAASSAVPTTESTTRRIAGQAPAALIRRFAGRNSSTEPSGAATIPASSKAASIAYPS